MTADEALLELAHSTADAVAGVLRMFLPDGVEVGEPAVLAAGTAPLEGVPLPGVAAEVSYTDGASGGNVFVTSVSGVRRLAAAMMGAEAADSDAPLDELELSAAAEAMNQMMAAAAGATASVLGQEVEISTPDVRDLATEADAAAIGADAPHVTRVPLVLAGEGAVLVQLVPRAFVVKMTRALDDRAASDFTPEPGTVPASGGGTAGPGGTARPSASRANSATCGSESRADSANRHDVVPASCTVHLPRPGHVRAPAWPIRPATGTHRRAAAP